MSIIPYNNFTVRDLSNVQQPYINSTSEVGYFRGGSLGPILKDKWYSLPASLNTNNGITSVDANGGLTILSAGIYKINLSLFPTTTQDGSSNISFNFGTTYLSNISTTNIVDAFGGICPTGMFTYDASNNNNTPGIISWVADGYNSANSTTNNFIKNSTTNELSYNYFNAGYSGGTLYSGNCTTEMTFFLDSSASIYFNVSTNSNTGVTMGNCSFTLELICNNTALIPSLNWYNSNAPSTTWSSIASDSGGSKLAASGTRIWTSNNYGVNWTLQIVNNLNWSAIAITGQPAANPYMAACVNGGYIYSSSDNGVNWFQRTFVPLNWTYISANYIASAYVACANGGGTWYSGDAGVTWSQKNSDATKKWSCITSDTTIAVCYACENGGSIWKSTNQGGTWTQQTSNSIPTNANWSSISMNYAADRIIACIDGGAIWFTTSSGTTWTQSSAGSLSWSSISLGSGNTANCYACVKGGGIWKSTNSGLNWSLITDPPNPANWSSITTDNGGGTVVACVKGGYIWVSTNTGGTWVQATFDATRDWSNVASNFSTFAAVVSNGPYIYMPINYTSVFIWTQQNTEFNRSWTSIASDSTRTKLAACASGNTGGIWTSSDSGLIWTPRTSLLPSGSLPTNVTWSSIASDSSGTNLVACVNGGGIYTSITSGSSWTLQTNPGSRSWTSIASDSTGQYLAACVNGGTIYTSSDSGVTWTPRTVGLPTTAIWSSIASASNSTGTNLAACVNGGYIYTSVDSGSTWTTNSNSSGINNWTSIASDSTGTNLAACVNGGGIWVSTNSGVTWSQQTTAPTANWRSIESSSTGANLAATALNNGIYTRLNI